MRIILKKYIFHLIVMIFAVMVLYHLATIHDRVNKSLSETRPNLVNEIKFERNSLIPIASDMVRLLQNTSNTRDVEMFLGNLYAATDAGLVKYDLTGEALKHYSVLDGLPESDLKCLAVWNDVLLIGTGTKGMIIFDGKKFENITWPGLDAKSVTAITALESIALIGTFNGGLLEFDGQMFTEIRPLDKRIKSINIIQAFDDLLFVGTYDNGYWERSSGVWSKRSKTDGLPSDRVVGIAVNDGIKYILTDAGLAIITEDRFSTIADLASASGISVQDQKVFLSAENGRIFQFDRALKSISTETNKKNAKFVTTQNKTYLVSDCGIDIFDGQTSSFSKSSKTELTDNFISALTSDDNGDIWVGTFRNGIDVLNKNGTKLEHIKTETINDINFLDNNGGKVKAATSLGMVSFKSRKPDTLRDLNNGLPSSSVSHFSDNFISTARGLAIEGSGKVRVLTATQGLPSNNVFTTITHGKKMYVGTLSGLAVLENNRVISTYKDSNSELKTNWVTALAIDGDNILIGTYGGGIFELTASGNIRNFEADIGRFVVNPNALFADGKYIFAGTLAGVKVYNTEKRSWLTIKNILPAETVMSIIANETDIIFGTTSGIAVVNKQYFENPAS